MRKETPVPRRYAIEKQTLAGVWWQDIYRYPTYKEAERGARATN
jgi:hypothetical protein